MRLGLSALLLLAFLCPARAEIQIEIVGGDDDAVPIVFLPFVNDSGSTELEGIGEVVKSDLLRSGLFKDALERVKRTIEYSDVINYRFYHMLGGEYAVRGGIEKIQGGQYRVRAELYDLLRKQLLWQRAWSIQQSQKRHVAHIISDNVFQTVVGTRGVFSHRLAYVLVKRTQGRAGRTYELRISDSDGYAPVTMLKSKRPILSPAWSPSGDKLAYVSFENRRPEIYIQDIHAARRERTVFFGGINSSPEWSPDGKSLLFTSSREGNPDLYLLNLKTRKLSRLTFHPAIDIEGVFSHDGRYVYFTSDRSGSAQIYRLNVYTRAIKRITFTGGYNARPTISGNGKMLAMISGASGQYNVVSMELASGDTRLLSDTFLDESPSFSPDGNMLIYSATNRDTGLGQLVVLSVHGRESQVLRSLQGDIRDPVWSGVPVK